MSDPRQHHTTDPRQRPDDSRPQHGDSGASRQAPQTVIDSQAITHETFAAYLMQQRRSMIEQVANIERLLGIDSTELRLRAEIKRLKAQLNQ